MKSCTQAVWNAPIEQAIDALHEAGYKLSLEPNGGVRRMRNEILDRLIVLIEDEVKCALLANREDI